MDITEMQEEQTDYANEAVEAAMQTLLWSSTDDNGEPFDSNYETEEISEEDRDRVRDMILAMIQDPSTWYILEKYDIDPEHFGHDFILTANGHGAGFWDRGYGQDGDYLTDMAKPYGDLDPYVGDDGIVYISGV